MSGATALSNTVALLGARCPRNGFTRFVFVLFSIAVILLFATAYIQHQRPNQESFFVLWPRTDPASERYNLMDFWITKPAFGNVECTLGTVAHLEVVEFKLSRLRIALL